MTDMNIVYVEPLTPREQQVARVVAKGLSNREIARELGITAETVKRHLATIYGKLAISGRVALAVRVVQGGVESDTRAA